jgi:hypothetical protein
MAERSREHAQPFTIEAGALWSRDLTWLQGRRRWGMFGCDVMVLQN